MIESKGLSNSLIPLTSHPKSHTGLMFSTDLDYILAAVDAVDPIRYGPTRNYVDGAVSKLSPYISRGVISTKFVFKRMLERGFEPKSIEKFIQELAWRDYWQQVWIAKGEEINQDLRQPQEDVENEQMPKALIEANTGIEAIDQAIIEFYSTGYLHNHLRMYIAAIACNMGKSHWKIPAQWMYYHLLDGDWASNALSWQWVAGSNSNKKYVANQENINKYCYSQQKGTFLDVPYEAFTSFEIPDELKTLCQPSLSLEFPKSDENLLIDKALPTLIYNWYNLDPRWYADISANRILLLEPKHFDAYPISAKSFDFMLNLAKDNIPGMQVFVGDFEELQKKYQSTEIHFKEHPLNRHYAGIEEPRDWMFEVKGYYRSFFAFWKKIKKQL